MTDMLDEAIGAVKFANGQTGNVHFVATIMKAVARGELIRATPDAIATSPEVQALIREAEARVMRIAAGLFPGGYDANFAKIEAAIRETKP